MFKQLIEFISYKYIIFLLHFNSFFHVREYIFIYSIKRKQTPGISARRPHYSFHRPAEHTYYSYIMWYEDRACTDTLYGTCAESISKLRFRGGTAVTIIIIMISRRRHQLSSSSRELLILYAMSRSQQYQIVSCSPFIHAK